MEQEVLKSLLKESVKHLADVTNRALDLEAKLAITVEALNKIGMAQMGAMDYTQDFFELTKTTVRETLEKIE